MKDKRYVILGLALFLVTLVGSALALEPTFNVNIPFAFTVHHTKFAPGAYTVKAVKPDLLLISGRSGAAFVAVTPDESPNQSAVKLTFQHYGETYLLSQVSGDGEGWDVPISRSEIALAKKGAPVEVGVASAN